MIKKEFIKNRILYTHANEGLITIFKDNKKLRVSTADYKNIYFNMGWRSKNYNTMNIILPDGSITKIKSSEFNKEYHKGINSNKQQYYNSITNSFELLHRNEVNLDIHFNKNKTQWHVFDSDNKLIEKSLNKNKLSNGAQQFNYLLSRASPDQKEFVLTKDILEKLKLKNRDFRLLNFKLVKVSI